MRNFFLVLVAVMVAVVFSARGQTFSVRTLKQSLTFSVVENGKLRLLFGISEVVKTNRLTRTETFSLFPDESCVQKTLFNFDPELTDLSTNSSYTSFLTEVRKKSAESTTEVVETFENRGESVSLGSVLVGTIVERNPQSQWKKVGAVAFDLQNQGTNAIFFIFTGITDDSQSFEVPVGVRAGGRLFWTPSLAGARTAMRKRARAEQKVLNLRFKTFELWSTPTTTRVAEH